jgi:hypothetical protein
MSVFKAGQWQYSIAVEHSPRHSKVNSLIPACAVSVNAKKHAELSKYYMLTFK